MQFIMDTIALYKSPERETQTCTEIHLARIGYIQYELACNSQKQWDGICHESMEFAQKHFPLWKYTKQSTIDI